MQASSFGSEHRGGVIRVVPEADDIVALCLEGDFDLANAPALGDEIDRALETGSNLILDLSESTFVDSSVISVVIQAATAAGEKERGQAIVLQLGTAAIVERVVEILGIEQVLTCFHDREEAVRTIQGQAATV